MCAHSLCLSVCIHWDRIRCLCVHACVLISCAGMRSSSTSSNSTTEQKQQQQPIISNFTLNSLTHSLVHQSMHFWLWQFSHSTANFLLSFSLSSWVCVSLCDWLVGWHTHTHRIALKSFCVRDLASRDFLRAKPTWWRNLSIVWFFKSHTTLTDLRGCLNHVWIGKHFSKSRTIFDVQIYFLQQSRICWLHNDNVPGNNLAIKNDRQGDLAIGVLRSLLIGFSQLPKKTLENFQNRLFSLILSQNGMTPMIWWDGCKSLFTNQTQCLVFIRLKYSTSNHSMANSNENVRCLCLIEEGRKNVNKISKFLANKIKRQRIERWSWRSPWYREHWTMNFEHQMEIVCNFVSFLNSSFFNSSRSYFRMIYKLCA